ncbi:hypothetical protein C8J57DRAFT_1714807, partial [Mycena rebaudengoi]
GKPLQRPTRNRAFNRQNRSHLWSATLSVEISSKIFIICLPTLAIATPIPGLHPYSSSASAPCGPISYFRIALRTCISHAAAGINAS